MALREMPCARASALKRLSQLSKLPEVRQSAASAAVARDRAANSAAANAKAVGRCLPIRFMIAVRFVRLRAGRAYITGRRLAMRPGTAPAVGFAQPGPP